MNNAERRAHPRLDISTSAEISFEDAEATDDAGRRSAARVDIAYQIDIELPLRIGGQEVLRLQLTGTTINVSQTGMLVRVEQDVVMGARCHVRFPEAKGEIKPDTTTGKVRRSQQDGNGYGLAIEFDAPLEVLKPADPATES